MKKAVQQGQNLENDERIKRAQDFQKKKRAERLAKQQAAVKAKIEERMTEQRNDQNEKQNKPQESGLEGRNDPMVKGQIPPARNVVHGGVKAEDQQG